MTSYQTKTSLRGLARQLGVSHVAISKAVRERRLTAGVRLDGDRVVVTDADAAASEWLRIHAPGDSWSQRMPRTRTRTRTAAGDEFHAPTRQRMKTSRVSAPSSSSAAGDVLLTVLPDPAMDSEVTAGELFEERDTFSLLATALAGLVLDATIAPGQAVALDGPVVAQLRERVSSQLRAVAELHRAEPDAIRRAEEALETKLWLLAELRPQESAA